MTDGTLSTIHRNPFISKVRLRHFKSAAEAEVGLAPFTLLVGENSSGKSSILQALRLVQQGARDRSTSGVFPISGDLVRLGKLYDVTTQSRENTPLSIGIDLSVPDYRSVEKRQSYHDVMMVCKKILPSIPENFLLGWDVEINEVPGTIEIDNIVSVSLRLDTAAESELPFLLALEREEHQRPGRRRPSSTELETLSLVDDYIWVRSGLRPIERDKTTPIFRGKYYGIHDNEPRLISLAVLEGSIPHYLAVRQRIEDIGASLRSEDIGMLSKFSKNQILELFVDSQAESNVHVLWAKALGSVGSGKKLLSDEPETGNEINALWDSERCAVVDFCAQFVRWWFIANDFRYLGPLREPPQVIERPVDIPGSADIGPRGQYCGRVLWSHAHSMIKVPMPDGGEQCEVELIEAVRSWATRLGLVDEVETEVGFPWEDSWIPLDDLGSFSHPEPEELAGAGHVTKVKPQGTESALPLSSVGVGVSQLLPVLVLCLLAEPGSVILLEQPELHLHPALQQRLADFFIAMVKSGRQLIVETHSEYMVSRLRRRIVEDPDDDLLDIAKVVFAERDQETGLSSYREVELSPYGAIEEWPAGFFDQAAEEERAIILGGVKKLRKRTAERQRSDA